MAEKKDFFEGVRSHFDSLETKIIEVEEWGLKGANESDLNVLTDVIIEKALTKDGEKMFDLEHKIKFKLKADTDVIAKVATAIMNTSDDTIPTLKKK
jgi:hypothetical protein